MLNTKREGRRKVAISEFGRLGIEQTTSFHLSCSAI